MWLRGGYYTHVVMLGKNISVLCSCRSYCGQEILRVRKYSGSCTGTQVTNVSPSAMAPHSSTLAWKTPRMEEPGRLQSVGWGREESDTTERRNFHFLLSCIGEGNGNPLQCSCLENPRDRGAWWAAVSGVAQNRTRLKRLSGSMWA